MQYRNKAAPSRKLFETSRELAGALIPRGVTFFVNDRADVAAMVGASGIHVGQDDLGAEQARSVVGRDKLVGISTHNLVQFEDALKTSADYIAVGPIFPTSSKTNPDPIVGTNFIRQIRKLTEKPIVAIGGITLERVPEVIEAGADSVAVIGDILRAEKPDVRAREYLDLLGEVNLTRHN